LTYGWAERESPPERDDDERSLSVYGDSAYGSGEQVNRLEEAGAEVNCKVQPPVSPGGHFSKDAFRRVAIQPDAQARLYA
jgi:hypothetical protein